MFDEIFKAYDIRGKVGDELNTDSVFAIGRAFAHFVDDGPVAVGRDMRSDSDELASAFAKGLKQEGRTVWDIGQVTSDMIYFTVGNYDLSGGAMITASHNPGEYNGIKLCREEARPIGRETGLVEIQKLAERFVNESINTAQLPDSIQKDVVQDWVKHALSFSTSGLGKHHIAIDAGNGMAGKVIPYFAEETNMQIEAMYFELDGTFPNHDANPLKEETLADLKQRIKEDDLDFGAAFDGDGDRAVLVDEVGRAVSGTVMSALLAKQFLKENPGATILYNAICGNIVPETIEKYGGRAVRTRVGHSYIKHDMRKEDAIFAGEHSGHYYFRDNWCADSGLIAFITATDLLTKETRPLSELVNEFDVYARSGEINFEVEDKSAVIELLATKYSTGKQDQLDGLTVRFDTWWFNVRPSNTEPVLRLNIEANNDKILHEKITQLKKEINEARKE